VAICAAAAHGAVSHRSPHHPIQARSFARGNSSTTRPDESKIRVSFSKQMPLALVVMITAASGDYRHKNGLAIGPPALAFDACWTGAQKQTQRLASTSPSQRANGVMSSIIQIPRPWVARTSSLSRG